MPQESETLVFLHGVGLDHTMWDPIRHLVPNTAIFLDLPGHGGQSTIGARTSLQQMADDIAAQLPAGPVRLVGFSLGGLLAQKLAIDWPDKIRSVVAISTVCKRTPAEKDAVWKRLQVARKDFAKSVQRSIERWYSTSVEVSAKQIKQTHAVLTSNDAASFIHAYEVFATADEELAEKIGGLQQPLLAITGELDPGSTPEMSYRLANSVQNGQAHIVEGARHMLPHEAPTELVERIRQHFALT